MLATFLGHQSWLLSENHNNILIDPILKKSFGSSTEVQFDIHPYREIVVTKMPRTKNILLTTEHMQHFQPRSFLTLAKTGYFPNVHVHELFPASGIEILNQLGFNTIRHFDGEKFFIDNFSIAFYSNDKQNLLWDARVASVVIETTNEFIIVQSDNLPSKKLIEDVRLCKKTLSAILATNNTPLNCATPGAGLENILPIRDKNNKQSGSINLIASLLTPFKEIPLAKNIVMCGSGYLDNKGIMKPPKWSLSLLADFANQLSLGTLVHRPEPGQCFNFLLNNRIYQCNWINRYDDKFQKKVEGQELQDDVIPLISNYRWVDLSEIEDQLTILAKSLVMSSFGKQLLRIGRYLERDLGTERFVIQLIDARGSANLVLDMASVTFHKKQYTGLKSIRDFPFGIRIPRNDFITLFQGKIQIWEVSMISARQWYVCNKFQSPMAFFYEFFNESIFQDLSLENYKQDLLLANFQ